MEIGFDQIDKQPAEEGDFMDQIDSGTDKLIGHPADSFEKIRRAILSTADLLQPRGTPPFGCHPDQEAEEFR